MTVLNNREDHDGKNEKVEAAASIHSGKDHGNLPKQQSSLAARLEELEMLPRRNAILHWTTFALSLLSLVLLANWVFGGRGPISSGWFYMDIGLGVFFAIEFFTRSGFRWQRASYFRTRFFDFIAIVPALALVNHGFFIEGVWVWLVLIARFARLVDRFLGDGFVRRNLLALLEGFEEEITDRVLDRIAARVQADLDKAGFSHGVADALKRNKQSVLERVRQATPRKGVVPEIAHVMKLDAALERAEERTYDAVVEIINSEEVDRAIRDVINSSFSRLRDELEEKSWRTHLGIWHRHSK